MEYFVLDRFHNIHGKIICLMCNRVCDRHDEAINNGWKRVQFTGKGHMRGICWKCDREMRANEIKI